MRPGEFSIRRLREAIKDYEQDLRNEEQKAELAKARAKDIREALAILTTDLATVMKAFPAQDPTWRPAPPVVTNTVAATVATAVVVPIVAPPVVVPARILEPAIIAPVPRDPVEADLPRASPAAKEEVRPKEARQHGKTQTR